MAAPRVISNSSTFKGWLESNGLDDMVLNPCGCIFGETEEPQIPIPGQRKYANQRSASARGRGGSMRNWSVRNGGRGLSRQQSVMSRTSMPPLPEDANYVPEEPSSKSPFAVLFGSAFAGWVLISYHRFIILVIFSAKSSSVGKNMSAWIHHLDIKYCLCDRGNDIERDYVRKNYSRGKQEMHLIILWQVIRKSKESMSGIYILYWSYCLISRET